MTDNDRTTLEAHLNEIQVLVNACREILRDYEAGLDYEGGGGQSGGSGGGGPVRP